MAKGTSAIIMESMSDSTIPYLSKCCCTVSVEIKWFTCDGNIGGCAGTK